MNRKVAILLCGIFVCNFSFGTQINQHMHLNDLNIARQSLLQNINLYLHNQCKRDLPYSIKQLLLRVRFFQNCQLNLKHKNFNIDNAVKILSYNNKLLHKCFETISRYNDSNEIEKNLLSIELAFELTQPLFEQTFIFNITY